jgi:ribonuclease BN (tRNA processing enzyme)
VHATEATINILKLHVFNWDIWPDFTVIPNEKQPYLRFEPLCLGETITLGERKITALPANHIVPAVGYQLDSGKASLVFSGDTANCDELWAAVNRIQNLKYLIVETAFCNAEIELARMSKHFCPLTLAADLQKLQLNPTVFITHLKPGEVELTMQEIAQCVKGFALQMLKNGQAFEF